MGRPWILGRVTRNRLSSFVKLLFGQASQSNACDKFHKAGAKEMLSLFAEKAFWGKAQTMWRRLEQNALPCDRQTVWTKADCSLQWPGIFKFGWDRVWLRPECHSGILFRLYTPFKPGNHSPLSRMKQFFQDPLENLPNQKNICILYICDYIVKPHRPQSQRAGRGWQWAEGEDMISKDITVSLAQICLSPKSVGPKSVSHRYEMGIIRRFSRVCWRSPKIFEVKFYWLLTTF